jgi:hypothetical protein
MVGQFAFLQGKQCATSMQLTDVHLSYTGNGLRLLLLDVSCGFSCSTVAHVGFPAFCAYA